MPASGSSGPRALGARQTLPPTHIRTHEFELWRAQVYNTGCEGITQQGLIRGALGQGEGSLPLIQEEADSRGQDPPSTRQGEGLRSSPHGTRTLRSDTCARSALPGDPQAGHESGRFTEPKDQRGQRDVRKARG